MKDEDRVPAYVGGMIDVIDGCLLRNEIQDGWDVSFLRKVETWNNGICPVACAGIGDYKIH